MTASLLRIAIGRPSLSRSSKLSSSKLLGGSRRALFQSATPAMISTAATTNATDNESTLRGMTLATLAATGLTLYGWNVQQKEKADCTAICAVVGKDQFDAR